MKNSRSTPLGMTVTRSPGHPRQLDEQPLDLRRHRQLTLRDAAGGDGDQSLDEVQRARELVGRGAVGNAVDLHDDPVAQQARHHDRRKAAPVVADVEPVGRGPAVPQRGRGPQVDRRQAPELLVLGAVGGVSSVTPASSGSAPRATRPTLRPAAANPRATSTECVRVASGKSRSTSHSMTSPRPRGRAGPADSPGSALGCASSINVPASRGTRTDGPPAARSSRRRARPRARRSRCPGWGPRTGH